MRKIQETCEINVGGNIRFGEYPRGPVRFLLQRARQNGLGFTDDDIRLLREGQDVDSTHQPDGYALALVWFAAFGLCWPEPIEPTFRELRHDVTAYGEVVYEWCLGQPDGDFVLAARDAGEKLYKSMLDIVTVELSEDIEAEADFTKDQGESSITG